MVVVDDNVLAVGSNGPAIGNADEGLYDAVNDSYEDMASIYVATESGFMVQADYISAKKFDESGK